MSQVRAPVAVRSLVTSEAPPASASSPARGSRTRASDEAAVDGRRLMWRGLIVAGLTAVVVAVMTAVPDLREVLGRIAAMRPGWLGLAVGLEVASCLSYVAVFRLFFGDIPARTARDVAWSEMGSGALLPGGGAGGLAIGGWMLRSAGQPLHVVLQRSSALFLLTSAVNVLALAVAALSLLAGASPGRLALAAVPLAVAVVVLAGAWVLPRLESHPVGRVPAVGWRHDLLHGVVLAKAPILRPHWRLAGAFGYLLFDIGVLWAAFMALGVQPPIAALVLGYLVGFLANLVPVPGGVGVLDAGLVAALVLYGLPPEATVAAVLVYHVIAFWVPSAGGALGYVRFRRRPAPPNELPTMG